MSDRQFIAIMATFILMTLYQLALALLLLRAIEATQ